ncbi:MAG: restriction endonuclease subunit S [Desulfuromonadaceae bacterium]|nr:restriction endonuclease subunit S [Desulfuromonadaceae bacterium]
MKTASLKDVCQISMGQAPDGSSYNDIGEGFPLIAGAGDFGTLSPKPKKFTREPSKVSEVDDIILCIRATIGDLNWSDKAYCLGRGVAGLRPRADKLDRHYLWHWLASQKDFLFSQGTGSTFKQISRSTIEDLSIPLPPLPEQIRIAAILDKADSIRRKRQEAVRLTEELLRSVFLDMFGDPVTNPKGWETRAFAVVCETRLGKMLDANQQTGEYLRPYLRNSNVQWDRIESSDLEQMDFNEKDRKTFSLKDGDVLICEGGEVGRAAIWRNQLTDCYFQKAIHRARPNQTLALPEYVMFWLWFMSKNGGFKDHVTSATIAHLTGEKLKEIQMTLPPITMQHQFLKVYNSLTTLTTSTDKYQAHTLVLFNAIQQRAFMGKL